MLHPNASDISMRMEKEANMLPLDGLLSQYGEVNLSELSLSLLT